MEHLDPPGSPIPGSRLVRDYCAVCGEAIRILPGDVGHVNRCIQCRGHRPPSGHNRGWQESDPWQENAVRAMEDG